MYPQQQGEPHKNKPASDHCGVLDSKADDVFHAIPSDVSDFEDAVELRLPYVPI